jgi:hypothetical protein
MTIPNKLFPGYVIQYHILRVHFSSNILIRYCILFLKLKGTDGNEGSIRIQKLCFRLLHMALAWLPYILSRVMNRLMVVLSQVRVRIRGKNVTKQYSAAMNTAFYCYFCQPELQGHILRPR